MKLLIAITSFIGLLVAGFFVYRSLFSYFKKRVSQTSSTVDDFILNLFKIPILWVIYSILIKIFTRIFIHHFAFSPYLAHGNTLLVIFSVTWMITQVVNAAAYYLQNKLDEGISDLIHVRKNRTHIKVFKALINSVIIIIAIAIGLLTFDKAKSIGVSLLTSAGIFGIIIGFAAQKSLALILAGIQIAITQPIRLEDLVNIEGESGTIEEITLTYVVVKIWDERRLIVPVNYFLEKPFQNWTRTGADIIGSVSIFVEYGFPVDRIREILPDMLKGNTNWDGKIMNVQVTNTTETTKEIRVLLSSSDASKNGDLRNGIREKLIDFINKSKTQTPSG